MANTSGHYLIQINSTERPQLELIPSFHSSPCYSWTATVRKLQQRRLVFTAPRHSSALEHKNAFVYVLVCGCFMFRECKKQEWMLIILSNRNNEQGKFQSGRWSILRVISPQLCRTRMSNLNTGRRHHFSSVLTRYQMNKNVILSTDKICACSFFTEPMFVRVS